MQPYGFAHSLLCECRQYAGVSVVEIKLLTDQLLDGRTLFFSQIVIRHRRFKEQRSGGQPRSVGRRPLPEAALAPPRSRPSPSSRIE